MNARLMVVDDHQLFREGLRFLLGTYGIGVDAFAGNGQEAIRIAREQRPDIILMDIRMPVLGGIDALSQIRADLPDTRVIMLTTSENEDDILESFRRGASGYLLKNTDGDTLVRLLEDVAEGGAQISRSMAAKLLNSLSSGIESTIHCDPATAAPNVGGHPATLPPESTSILSPASTSEPPSESTSKPPYESTFKPPQSTSRLPSEPPSCLAQPIPLDCFSARQIEILRQIADGVSYKEIGTGLGISERTVKYHVYRMIDQIHVQSREQVLLHAVKLGLIGNSQ